MKFLIGKKQDMKQVFAEDGSAKTVTVVKAGPCFVTAKKMTDKDGYNAIQLAWESKTLKNVNKPVLGFFKKIFNKEVAYKVLKECRVSPSDKMLEILNIGDQVDVSMFQLGDLVDVSGVSKGRGFQGVVKRYGFHGSPKSHGHKDQLRMPGSIGAGGVQRVFKGKKMGGHMGDQAITVKNLEVVAIDLEKNEIMLSGSIPGARNGVVYLKAAGDFEIKKVEVPNQPEIVAHVEAPVEVTSESVSENTQNNS